jgi:hypothetical protein
VTTFDHAMADALCLVCAAWSAPEVHGDPPAPRHSSARRGRRSAGARSSLSKPRPPRRRGRRPARRTRSRRARPRF